MIPAKSTSGSRKRLALAAALWLAAGSLALAARVYPQTTPLQGVNLFISPCGKPYRSKPGEPYPVVAWFHEGDINKDGRLDRDEFKAQAQAFFKVLDRNGDGVVDDQEISYYENELAPEITVGIEPAMLSPGGGQPRLILVQGGDTGGSATPPKAKESDQPPQGAAVYGLLNDAEPVRSADRHLEGRISIVDFLARADHNFDRLDDGSRGYLTLETLPRTPAQGLADPVKRA